MTSLQPPGSGLPPLERFFLHVGLQVGSAVLPDRRALDLFRREADTILEIVDDADYDFASQQVLVPRFQGMEDSSRRWSLFMVLDHLCRVDREILRTIDVLRDGITPRGEIEIAWYKPDADCGAETMDEFRHLIGEFCRTISSQFPLRGTPRFAHPWFGPQDAHGWLCLAAFHHRIHRKQARKIAAMLGPV
jgi:hypothetical protein